MKKLDASDLFLIFALILTITVIYATFSYTKNFRKEYSNLKITIVK